MPNFEQLTNHRPPCGGQARIGRLTRRVVLVAVAGGVHLSCRPCAELVR